jgi:hypothetical protein
MAVSWEILEFTSDYFFNTNHQRWMFNITKFFKSNVGVTKQPSGLIETMTDIMAVIGGALLMIFFTRKRLTQYNQRRTFKKNINDKERKYV